MSDRSCQVHRVALATIYRCYNVTELLRDDRLTAVGIVDALSSRWCLNDFYKIYLNFFLDFFYGSYLQERIHFFPRNKYLLDA